MIFKRPRIKDAAHLEFLRELPCCACGNDVSTEAAHIRSGSLKYGKRPTGLGERPSDRWCLPLCSQCHREQHRGGNEMNFWTNKGKDPFVIAMTLFVNSGDHETCTKVLSHG